MGRLDEVIKLINLYRVTGPILSDWSQWYDFDSVPIEDIISP